MKPDDVWSVGRSVGRPPSAAGAEESKPVSASAAAAARPGSKRKRRSRRERQTKEIVLEAGGKGRERGREGRKEGRWLGSSSECALGDLLRGRRLAGDFFPCLWAEEEMRTRARHPERST